MDNTSITFEDIYANFLSSISSDKRFKNIGSATLIGMYLEMLAATSDMANFNLQRMQEEGFFRTARLDSSYIKLCKNWGYAPRRPIPAQGSLSVVFKGPFPKELKNLPENETLTITLTNDQCNLSFLDMPFRLTDPIKYKFTKSDISNCTSPTWSKKFKSVIIDNTTKELDNPLILSRDPVNNANRFPIKCYQGEIKTLIFDGEEYIAKQEGKEVQEENGIITVKSETLGQRFDINDLSFSNWYGIRDPFAVKFRHFNKDSTYTPSNGLTKVYTRFKNSGESKIFHIEDRSILLDERILTNFGANPQGDSRPCTCLLETNPDKTVSFVFGPYSYLAQLAFEGKRDPNTNKIIYPDLYIKYLSTRGAFGNKTGITESQLTNNTKLMLHTSVGTFDITNNVQFLFADDLTGGENFESKESMYDNAEAYWTSQLKLVSKRDFINYFNSLTTPIDVLCALVFGLKELDNTYETNMFKKAKDMVSINSMNINLNYLFYTLASHMYINTGKNVYMPRNIFVKDSKDEWITDGFVAESDNADNPATLYCDEYNEHIADYIKCIVSPEAYYNKYALLDWPPAKEDSQYMKNIKEIDHNVKLLTPTNTVVMSLPPFLHYYDLVGDIEVDAGTENLDDFKEKLQTKIYKYLDTLTLETREIYKSNLIKLCMDEDHVLNANLNIKVSDLIAPTFKNNTWNETDQIKGVRVILNTEKLTSEYDKYKNMGTYADALVFNEIIIPRTDSEHIKFDVDSITPDSTIHIQFRFYTDNIRNLGWKNEVDHSSKFTVDNTNLNYIKIYLHTPFEGVGDSISLPSITNPKLMFMPSSTEDLDVAQSEVDEELRKELIKYGENTSQCRLYNILAINSTGGFHTTVSYGNNYWSDSKYDVTEERATEYGLTKDTLQKLDNDVKTWMNGLYTHNTADRPIDLPYNIKSFDVTTRSETILRRGDLISNSDITLSEKDFWNYLIKMLLNKYYATKITETTPITDNAWTHAELLIIDLYKLFKPGISDSILDDNNNIVNYSMDQDIAIIRCKFNVKYQTRI